MYGKGKTFTRPILILTKYSKDSFLGVPLSTKIKDRFGYYRLSFEDKEACAALHDIKKIDGRRLGKKIGKLSELKFKNLKDELCKMIFDPQR